MTWRNFADAIRNKFYGNPEETEVHVEKTNATRQSKETVVIRHVHTSIQLRPKKYCSN